MSKAETPAAPQDIATTAPGGNGRATRRHRPGPSLTTCGVCDRQFPQLTRRHLRTHGLTPAQYGRVYGTPTAHALTHAPADTDDTTHGSYSGIPIATLQHLADACAESPEFLNRLATDVGAHLLGGRTRGLLAASLGALIACRLRQAGDATARLEDVNRELSESWRLEHGGEDGGPTPTRDVLALHAAAAAELDRASDAILRAGKLAIDERRGQTGEAVGDAPLDRYTGAGDAMALPDDVGPGERAIMLALLERMAAQVQRHSTVIDVKPREGDTPLVISPPAE